MLSWFCFALHKDIPRIHVADQSIARRLSFNVASLTTDHQDYPLAFIGTTTAFVLRSPITRRGASCKKSTGFSYTVPRLMSLLTSARTMQTAFFSGPGAFLNTPLCQVALLEPRATMFFGSVGIGRRFSFGVPQWDFPTVPVVSGIAAKRAPTPNANRDISSGKRLEISVFPSGRAFLTSNFRRIVLVRRLEHILAGSWPNLNFKLCF